MKILIMASLIGTILMSVAEGYIGITWGRQSYQRLIPSSVVDVILQNGIQNARIFTAADNVIPAFSGSEIDLSISISNYVLHLVNSSTTARNWIQRSVTKYRSQNVNVKYVHVGAEPFSTMFGNKTYDKAVDVLKLVQNALSDSGYGGLVKATISHHTDVLKLDSTMKPSHAEFRDDIKDKMVDYLQCLKQDSAPAMVNILPFYFCYENGLDLEFAFLDHRGSSFYVLDDNGLNYTNAFDLLYDSFYWAMKKVGVPDVGLTVGETGWPTDGHPIANNVNAERYYKHLLLHVASNKGSPMRPGSPIDVYLHSLVDENQLDIMSIPFHRHWGIYNSNGEPKYKIDFSGRGRDINPPSAKGIVRMPQRWCVFNGNTRDMRVVREEFVWACSQSDCSSLAPGGSCGGLDFKQRVSYAFNRNYQVRQQQQQSPEEEACSFKGLSLLVYDDPSTGTCTFPIEILAAETTIYNTSFLGIIRGPEFYHVNSSTRAVSLPAGMIMQLFHLLPLLFLIVRSFNSM